MKLALWNQKLLHKRILSTFDWFGTFVNMLPTMPCYITLIISFTSMLKYALKKWPITFGNQEHLIINDLSKIQSELLGTKTTKILCIGFTTIFIYSIQSVLVLKLNWKLICLLSQFKTSCYFFIGKYLTLF